MKRIDKRVLYIEGIGKLLPDDAIRKGRSSALDWGKFRCKGDQSPVGIIYMRRREAIKALESGPAILCCYDEILIHYGFAQIAPLRGFIVNYEFNSATPGQIAQAVGLSVALVEQAVPALLDVGLLVWAKRPDFADWIRRDVTQYTVELADDADDAESTDDPWRLQGEGRRPAEAEAPKRKGGNRRRKMDRRLDAAAAAKAAAAGQDGVRPSAGNFPAGGRTAADARETPDSRLQTPDPRDQTPPAASALPSPPSADGCGKTPEEKQPAPAAPPPADPAEPTPEAQTPASPQQTAPPQPDVREAQRGDCALPLDAHEPPPTADASRDSGQREALAALQAHASLPAEPQPVEPTEADPGPAGGPALPVADLTWHAERMAQQVFDVLYPCDAEVARQGRMCRVPRAPDEFRRTELAAFASGLSKALTGLDQVGAVRLLEWALKAAQGTHRKRPHTVRGRLFMYELNSLIRSRFGRSSGGPRHGRNDA
jgi:hypothetical protein